MDQSVGHSENSVIVHIECNPNPERNSFGDVFDHSVAACSANKNTSILIPTRGRALGGILFKKKKECSVHFLEPIVSEVYVRPRTDEATKDKLFFTNEDYQFFRDEYIRSMDQEQTLTAWIKMTLSVLQETFLDGFVEPETNQYLLDGIPKEAISHHSDEDHILWG